MYTYNSENLYGLKVLSSVLHLCFKSMNFKKTPILE